MTIIDPIVFGIVQGLTEFLPVSSSGHLTLFHNFLGGIEDNVLYDVVLHLGTLCATLLFFRAKILELINGAILEIKNVEIFDGVHLKRILFICLAVLPTGIIGVLFKDQLENLFGNAKVVGLMLLVTAAFLMASKYFKESKKGYHEVGFIKILIIGITQGLSIIPGISRSGSTICMSTFLGIDRKEAGEFSFLISISAILGAVLIKLMDIL